MGSSFKAWVNSNNLVLIIISLYFLISIIKIEHPGVNNDQLMFVNAATLNPDNPFLWKSFHGFPVMIFPYIGALKAYFYMPIFYIFGVNIWSIRLPQIILISISLYLLYKLINFAFNKKIALLTILFLGLDPSLIAYSRVDNGPNVLEIFLKVLALYLFYLYVKIRKGIFFVSIYPVLALGIFNKINFFWFVNAFMLSFMIFYIRSFYNDFKSYGRYFPLALTALVLIPYYLLIRLFIRLSKETSLSYREFGNEISIDNIFTNFPTFLKNLSDVTGGNIFFNTVYGYNPTAFGGYFATLMFSIFLIGLIYILILYKSTSKTFLNSYLFFGLIGILISLQILLTKRATAAWHTLAIYPFLTIIFAAGIAYLYEKIRSKNIRIIVVFLVALMLLYQAVVNYLYINKYSQPTKSISWSSSIYEVIDFAKNTNTIFVCIDIDICSHLLSFTQQTGKFREETKSFDNIKNYFNNPDFLYVSHGSTNTHIPLFRESFFKYIEDKEIKLRRIKQFHDGDTVTFEIYRVIDTK